MFHLYGAKLTPVPNCLFYTVGAKLTGEPNWVRCQIVRQPFGLGSKDNSICWEVLGISSWSIDLACLFIYGSGSEGNRRSIWTSPHQGLFSASSVGGICKYIRHWEQHREKAPFGQKCVRWFSFVWSILELSINKKRYGKLVHSSKIKILPLGGTQNHIAHEKNS